MTCGIYSIMCFANGMEYLGSSIDVERRFKEHKNLLRARRHESKMLQDAWNKHGAGAFRFEVLEEVENREELRIIEKKYILRKNTVQSGFNQTARTTPKDFYESKTKDLWRHCMKCAPECENVQELMERATEFLTDNPESGIALEEMAKTVSSAWRREVAGKNAIGNAVNWRREVRLFLMKNNVRAFALYEYLMLFNENRNTFYVANRIGEDLGWSVKSVGDVRKFLVDHGILVLVKKPTTAMPGLYKFGKPSLDILSKDSA